MIESAALVAKKPFGHFLCRYFHWEMCSWMWSTLAVIYLSYCPINARYYEFTVGMSLVSVTVSSMSNVLSDYRNNLEPGMYLAIIKITLDIFAQKYHPSPLKKKKKPVIQAIYDLL